MPRLGGAEERPLARGPVVQRQRIADMAAGLAHCFVFRSMSCQ